MTEIPHRWGRVYLGPSTGGPHEGYKGLIEADALGVHIDVSCEYLLVDREGVESEWIPVEIPVLVPWHRVDSIEWRPDLFTDRYGGTE